MAKSQVLCLHHDNEKILGENHERSIDAFVGRANHDSCQNSNQMRIPKPTNDDSKCSPSARDSYTVRLPAQSVPDVSLLQDALQKWYLKIDTHFGKMVCSSSRFRLMLWE